MVDANPQQEGRRRFSPERFQFATPSPIAPKQPWEHGKSWFEINLPNLLATATQLSLLPLELVAPGVGMASGAIAGQGVKLGTQKLQGRDVTKDDLVSAGVGAGTGAAQAGISSGMSSMKESMEAAELAQKTQVGANMPVPDTTYSSQLAKDAGVGGDFFSRDSVYGPGGEVINNPSYDQLATAADRRMATVHYGNMIGQGQDLNAQQQIANQQFGGPTGAPLNPGAQQQLERMYPGLKIPESTRQPAMALGESAFSDPQYHTSENFARMGGMPTNEQEWGNLSTEQQNYWRNQQSPMPAPMPTSGGGNLQSAMPVAPPTTPQATPNPLRQPGSPAMMSGFLEQPRSPYDVYRQQNPYFDPNNPFNNRLMSGRGF